MKITELLKVLEQHKTRSAWNNGVKGYAIEMLERLLENGTTEFCGSPADRKKLLNGAGDWSEASWDDHYEIYNSDIAERLCTPSELKRTRNGERRPNSKRGMVRRTSESIISGRTTCIGACKVGC